MLRKIQLFLLMFLICLFFAVPSYADQSKLWRGIGMVLVGAAVASSGFAQVDKTTSQTIPLSYTWTNKEVQTEWDFMYKLETYNMVGTMTGSTLYSDPSSASSVEYTWSNVDVWDYNDGTGSAGTRMFQAYFNHHITYQTVTYTGTKNMTVTTTYKEISNPTVGWAGVAVLSVGANQIVEYFQEQAGSKYSKKNNMPAFQFSVIPGKLSLMASIKY